MHVCVGPHMQRMPTHTCTCTKGACAGILAETQSYGQIQDGLLTLTRGGVRRNALDFLQLGTDAVVVRVSTQTGGLEVAVAQSWTFSPGDPFVGDAVVGPAPTGGVCARPLSPAVCAHRCVDWNHMHPDCHPYQGASHHTLSNTHERGNVTSPASLFVAAHRLASPWMSAKLLGLCS